MVGRPDLEYSFTREAYRSELQRGVVWWDNKIRLTVPFLSSLSTGLASSRL